MQHWNATFTQAPGEIVMLHAFFLKFDIKFTAVFFFHNTLTKIAYARNIMLYKY